MIWIITSASCTAYGSSGHPERPERITRSVDHLRKHDFGSYEWIEPQPASEEQIQRVHPRDHIDRLKSGQFTDSDSPNYPDIYQHALLSAGAAIGAARLALEGKHAFSLMRPPGHHCTRDQIMGFCYLNNMAIALETVRAENKVQKAAILDFDCHHGNGTEAVYNGDKQTLFVSIHQSPCYPGTGIESTGNIVNLPVSPGTGEEAFLAAVRAGMERIIEFQPDLLGISAGFDAYKKDPITDMGLEVGSFGRIARELSAPGIPSFALLEGGYAAELPLCIASFLETWYPVRS